MAEIVQGVRYAVDIVMCIDTTRSMYELLEKVKAGAIQFHEDLNRRLKEKDRLVDTLRVRVIAFRDFYADGDKSLRTSPFFTLPQDKEGFSAFVKTLEPDGGGDEPETSLEALAIAIKSDWLKGDSKQRQVIVMWTDASAHPLEKNDNSKPSHYPADMPKNFDDLTDWWEGQSYLSNKAKRLILYAPDAYPWTDISNHWNNCVHYPSKAGAGLEEMDYVKIVDTIANSV